MIDFEDYCKPMFDVFQEQLEEYGEDSQAIEEQITAIKEVIERNIGNAKGTDYYKNELPFDDEHIISELQDMYEFGDLPEKNLDILRLLVAGFDFTDMKEVRRLFLKELSRSYLIELFQRDCTHRLAYLLKLIENQNNEEKPNNENGRTD